MGNGFSIHDYLSDEAWVYYIGPLLPDGTFFTNGEHYNIIMKATETA